MTIAIHYDTISYAEDWIKYCETNNISYKKVNCYDSDIMEQLKNCDALMWHHHHANYKDVILAKALIRSLEQKGIPVYPNSDSDWHFDNKLAQKYLLEGIDAPMVPSYAFYDEKTAIAWADETNFPKVFKLKGGAASENVRLAKTKKQAINFIKKSFRKGWSQYDSISGFKERVRLAKQRQDFLLVLRGIARFFIPPTFSKMAGKEKGYAYFQDFIPNNTCDFRIQIVEGKCWTMRRFVRKNDFRASGSNMLDYDQSKIPKEMIKTSFDISSKLNMPTIAIDYVLDANNKPLIVEICYCFGIAEDELNHGYWDKNLNYYNEKFNPFGDMVKGITNKIKHLQS